MHSLLSILNGNFRSFSCQNVRIGARLRIFSLPVIDYRGGGTGGVAWFGRIGRVLRLLERAGRLRRVREGTLLIPLFTRSRPIGRGLHSFIKRYCFLTLALLVSREEERGIQVTAWNLVSFEEVLIYELALGGVRVQFEYFLNLTVFQVSWFVGAALLTCLSEEGGRSPLKNLMQMLLFFVCLNLIDAVL